MIKIVFILALFGILGCSSSDPIMEQQISKTVVSWSVPKEDILGPYSAFPLVTNGSFVGVNDVSYSENHLTALVSLGPTELRAYPNEYIGLYEVINNEFGDKKFAVTHCPLTGSTICWDRILGNELLTLKASGYLYHENVMPTDIETGTIWSQMLMRAVSGKYDGKFHNTYNVVETDWKTVKTHFPHAKVYHELANNVEIGTDPVTEPTNRDFYRYGILAGINNIQVHLFKYDNFDQEGLKLITTTITGKKILVIGNKDLNFITSYVVDSNSEFTVDPSNIFNFKDNKGNFYNAMGLVIEGPGKDRQLDSPKAYTAAWVAWQDFYDNFLIYE